MTTEPVLIHSAKHDRPGTHETRVERCVLRKIKTHNNVTSLDKAAHHKAPECTENTQRDRDTLSDLYKTKYLCISFPKWGFVWQQMTCIWVRYAGMILYNFMQRWGTWVEKTQLFLNGCLHWKGITCPGRMSLQPFSLPCVSITWVAWSGSLPKTDF